MNILKTNNNLNLLLNTDNNFKTDLGWHENLIELEEQSLNKIINIADNYETVRFIHKPYVSSYGIYQTDIWFYFYFLKYLKNFASLPHSPSYWRFYNYS